VVRPVRGNRIAIVGVGYSEVGRRTEFSYQDLTIQAAKAAFADGAIVPADIDGVTCRPRGDDEDRALPAPLVGHMLGINPLNWYNTPPMNYGDMIAASIAGVKSGLCHTCLCVHPLKVQWSGSIRPKFSEEQYEHGASLDDQFTVPFGSLRPIQHAGAMAMQRYMSVYGVPEEHFGLQQVAQRTHASLNEDAFFRVPLTLEDYLASEYISKPCRLLDCDMPCDMAGAVIITTEERAREFAKPPVFIESFAMADTRADWDDLDAWATWHCGKMLWSRTNLRPTDISCAQLYDGYSILTFMWLEALGFCGLGEAGEFIAAGHTKLGGSLPLNTDGGVCNLGRRHGASHIIEAVQQLRGDAGPRQVPGATASVFSIAGGFWGTAGLLTIE